MSNNINSIQGASGINEQSVSLFEQVKQKIITVRDCQVMLDVDVAALYGVETMRVNEAVKNNPDKFPDGYILTLNKEEKMKVIEIFDNPKLKFSPAMPKAFTEKGLYMLATILKSKRAVEATFAIIETFAAVRAIKSEMRSLHSDVHLDEKTQQTKLQRFGEMLSGIIMPDLETSETESSMEVNFFIGKIKHTVRRVKKQNDKDRTEVE